MGKVVSKGIGSIAAHVSMVVREVVVEFATFGAFRLRAYVA